MPQPDMEAMIEAEAETETPRGYWNIIGGIASLIGQPFFSRGDLAALRRMNPDAPSAPAFWQLLTLKVPEQFRRNNDAELRWALIIQGVALMAPRHMANDSSIGRAFAAIDLSELRLAKLLNARKGQFRAQISRLARHLAAKGQPVDWRPLGELILTEGRDEHRADDIRMAIARDYFGAIARKSK